MSKEINNAWSTQHKRRAGQGMLDAWDYLCQERGVMWDLHIRYYLGGISCHGHHFNYPISDKSMEQSVDLQTQTGADTYAAGWKAAERCHFELYNKDHERKNPKPKSNIVRGAFDE